MNQIAIGDPKTAWTVLHGQSVAAPFFRATAFFAYALEPTIKEKIEIELKGTLAQISAGITALELIVYRSLAYAQAHYPSPQYLRFQPEAGGAYHYAALTNLYLASNLDGYKTRSRGSLIVELHYSRPNYFDGDQVELPLTGRGGTDVTGGITLYNHTDFHAGHGNTALIKPADFQTELPAPLRLEAEYTHASANLFDFHTGIYHHPTHDADTPFFVVASTLVGGSLLTDPTAINDQYRAISWTATAWASIFSYPITNTDINLLDGRNYRLLVHLHTSHAYTDLFLRVKLQRGSEVLFVGEPVYADPSRRYIWLPPMAIPPNQLLREQLPHALEIVVYAQKTSAASYTLNVDQLQLFPLDFAANFVGFFPASPNDILIYDSHRDLTNVRYTATGYELVSHVRQGGPLFLWPGSHNRLFIASANSSYIMEQLSTYSLRLFYRNRKRLI